MRECGRAPRALNATNGEEPNQININGAEIGNLIATGIATGIGSALGTVIVNNLMTAGTDNNA